MQAPRQRSATIEARRFAAIESRPAGGETSGSPGAVSARFTAAARGDERPRSARGYALAPRLKAGSIMLLALALSLLIGVSLGLLGGGGSILTLPILTYALGMETKAAIAASLFVVGVTSAIGLLAHARAGRVAWRTGLLFGAAGMVGAFAGGRAAAFIPSVALLVAFAGIMIATGVAMLRGGGRPAAKPRDALPVVSILVEGAVVGVVTGIVGAGGGFLVVPALVLLGGLPMEIAVGTSLVVIAMKSFAGLAGHLGHVDVAWASTLAVTAAAVVGAVAGGHLAGVIPPERLRRGFGVLVLAMAALMLADQLGLF